MIQSINLARSGLKARQAQRLMHASHMLNTAVARSASTGKDGARERQMTTSQTGDYVAREVRPGVIDLSVGQPSPSSLPLNAMAAAAAHRLGSPDAELLLQYGPRQGYRSFRSSLAAFLSQRYGSSVDPDHLMVTAGVSHGLDLAVGALSRPGDMIVVECPTYFLVTPIFRDNNRLTVVPMPTDTNGLVVEELERWLAADPSHRPRLLYTIPIHNNPRATTLPPERRRLLLRLAHRYGFQVLADEVYQLLSFPPEEDEAHTRSGPSFASSSSSCSASSSSSSSLPLPLRCYEECDPRVSRVISFGSFSKILAPALRLGWLETPHPGLMERFRSDGVVGSGGCIAQLAAGLAHSALELGLQSSHLDTVVRPTLASRCRTLVAALRREVLGGG
ncbi:hypothetical protein Agub_g10694, partial [Astrephomene gubernaculifera]